MFLVKITEMQPKLSLNLWWKLINEYLSDRLEGFYGEARTFDEFEDLVRDVIAYEFWVATLSVYCCVKN